VLLLNMNRRRLQLVLLTAISLTVADAPAQLPDASLQRSLPARELASQAPASPAPKGSPAITPHIAAVPAFTIDDAQQYVATHALLRGAARGYAPNVTRAEFLTSRQVSERLHGAATGYPADRVLCYVELQGPFTFPGPQGATATYSRGVLIFDAQTGNLVISGGMP